MSSYKLLSAEKSALLIVDVQEKFRNHIINFEPLVKNIIRLIESCQILNIPIFITEQYPKGLGQTIQEIKKHWQTPQGTKLLKNPALAVWKIVNF